MIRALLLSVLAALASTGCADVVGDVCDQYCDCEGCNDLQYEDCTIRVEAALDIADTYECDVEADELWACAVDRSYCEDGDWHYRDRCAVDDDAVDWCVSRSSMLRHSFPNPGLD